MKVRAFMEVAAQRRDMLCLGQFERAVVHSICMRSPCDHVYPIYSYPTNVVGYARNLIDQHCIDVLDAGSRSVLDQAG